MIYNKKIVLKDGREFYGQGFGADRDAICELVFNTSMVGYQEIISDPSYTDQMVLMTYPIIGNYGITDEDFEAKAPTIGSLAVRDYNDIPSNFRYTETLSEILKEYQIPAISEIDTRMLTRIIRDEGSQNVLLTSAEMPKEEAVSILEGYKPRTDAVARVSCKKKWYSRTSNPLYNVVAIDCGIKHNIIRCLNRYRCNVTIVPYNTSPAEILSLRPDGLFISNGPGNPEDVVPVIETIRALIGKLPIFGIALGHQLIALACGAKTYKMKFGHRGGNSVKNISTDKLEMTSQNHSYTVLESSLKDTGLKITHINVLDQTIEGLSDESKRIFSVQYNPESAPGPQDSLYLFDQFINIMETEVRTHA